MRKPIEVKKFPEEGPHLVIIWVIFLVGAPLAIAALRMSLLFSVFWLAITSSLVAFILISHSVQFGAECIRERKLVFGVFPISSKILAPRNEAISMVLVTSNGPTDDLGAQWLYNHEHFIHLSSGSLVLAQRFNSSPTKEPREVIEKSRELAHAIGLPFEHRQEC